MAPFLSSVLARYRDATPGRRNVRLRHAVLSVRTRRGCMARDWNSGIIEEFRANEGRVAGPFEGRTLLLLHHKGARTGTLRVNPLAYQALADGTWAIFASKGGAPTNPDWYHNLRANPDAVVELG